MAGFESIAAVGLSLERLLAACFAQTPPIVGGAPAKVSLVDTEAFRQRGQNQSGGIPAKGLSIFLHRVEANNVMRPAWSSVGNRDGRGHLPLDLHFLLTPWATNAEHELLILGRAMQCLESFPILTGPLLDPSGRWEPADAIQVVLDDMSTEDVMRTFDALRHVYKLSISYVTRVVRIETALVPLPEVTASFLGLVPSVEP